MPPAAHPRLGVVNAPPGAVVHRRTGSQLPVPSVRPADGLARGWRIAGAPSRSGDRTGSAGRSGAWPERTSTTTADRARAQQSTSSRLHWCRLFVTPTPGSASTFHRRESRHGVRHDREASVCPDAQRGCGRGGFSTHLPCRVGLRLADAARLGTASGSGGGGFPLSGSPLLSANHDSAWDPLVIGAAGRRHRTTVAFQAPSTVVDTSPGVTAGPGTRSRNALVPGR
jgi:hypothetical protein